MKLKAYSVSVALGSRTCDQMYISAQGPMMSSELSTTLHGLHQQMELAQVSSRDQHGAT